MWGQAHLALRVHASTLLAAVGAGRPADVVGVITEGKAMHLRMRLPRVLSGLSLALIAAGTVTVLTVFATGFGQGNFESANKVGVDTASIHGYNPAPSAYDASGGSVSVQFDFTVHRYTGANHGNYTDTVSIPDAVVRVSHVTAVAGTDVTSGDPSFTEAYLLAHAGDLTENVVSTQPLSIALPAGQDASVAETFTVTIPGCGYYELDAGHSDSGQLNDFAVLAAGYVRATGCQASSTPSPTASPTSSVQGVSTTPTPTSSVQGISTTATAAPTPTGAVQAVSTPETGAASDLDGVAGGLLFLGAGLLALVRAGRRRY